MKFSNLYSVSDIMVDDVRFSAITYSKREKDTNVVILHTHSYYELFACINGEICIETEEKTITVGKNGVAVIPPEVRHRCVSPTNNADWCAVGYTFEKLSDESMYGLNRRLSMIAVNRITVFENVPQISRNVMDTFLRATDAPFNAALRICTSVDDLIHSIRDAEWSRLNDRRERSHRPDITSYIDSLIDFYFAENITLTDISHFLFLSRRQITRIVKEYYHKTFFELLNDKRINVAKYLLETENLPIEKLAEQCGFPSVNGFYREFKKRCAMTPARYRAVYGKHGNL